MRRSNLPDALGSRFTVADASAGGVSRSRLRANDLRRPFHAVRSRGSQASGWLTLDRFGLARGAGERAHLERALDYVPRMAEHEFFCGVTAAMVQGVPMPSHLLDHDLDVAVFAPRRSPRSIGVRGHQASPSTTRVHIDAASGLRVTTPATTWAMLGAVIQHPHDLIAAADAIVRDWRVPAPLATVAQLQAATDSGRRVGVGRLREALPFVRTRSASRPESRCRLVLIEAGLPEPELNYDVFERGVFLGCIDLAYPDLRIAIEYEGEHHLLDPDQWARDIDRYDRLREAGWIVIRVTKAELFRSPLSLANRVRRAIAARS
ncbi:endonuclease domain-containing protein [Microbacterium sp. P06]|uniref:endonuclease domain-containing protein n=1 Tax=Microbacterium sp. P06 TaxID=3366949 RepID=UPI0037471534